MPTTQSSRRIVFRRIAQTAITSGLPRNPWKAIIACRSAAALSWQRWLEGGRREARFNRRLEPESDPGVILNSPETADHSHSIRAVVSSCKRRKIISLYRVYEIRFRSDTSRNACYRRFQRFCHSLWITAVIHSRNHRVDVLPDADLLPHPSDPVSPAVARSTSPRYSHLSPTLAPRDSRVGGWWAFRARAGKNRSRPAARSRSRTQTATFPEAGSSGASGVRRRRRNSLDGTRLCIAARRGEPYHDPNAYISKL